MKDKTLTLITWSIFLVIGLMAGLYIEGHREPKIWDTQDAAYNAGLEAGLQLQLIRD